MHAQTEDVRTRLLETAGEIFAERGFSAAKVRDICKAAEANVASVNYYFGDKMGLYIETVKHAHAANFSDPPPQWPSGTAAEIKLRGFIRGMLMHLLNPTRPAWNAKLMMREMAEPTDACKQITEQYIRPMFCVLISILRELLPADVTDDKLHMTAFSVVGQCVFYRVQEPVARELVGEEAYASYAVDQIAAHIAGFTLAALGHSLSPPAARPAL